MKNCGGDDAVLKVDEKAEVVLNENCELVPKGTVESKGFKTAEIKYTVKKNKLPLAAGTSNVCEQMEKADEDVKGILSTMGLPQKCPVEAGKIEQDGSQKANIEKWSKYLSMGKGGPIEVTADLTHDTVSFSFDILRVV